MNKFSGKKGFTLIEVLVVIGITTVISGIVLTYTSSGRERLALQIERAKLVQVISRAKAMAISTYNEPTVPCGYGVRIDSAAKKYSVFRYTVSPCTGLDVAGINYLNTDSYKPVVGLEFSLPKNMSFAPGSIETIFFLPPDPKTLIWKDGLYIRSGEGEIILKNQVGTNYTKVNSGGQISFSEK